MQRARERLATIAGAKRVASEQGRYVDVATDIVRLAAAKRRPSSVVNRDQARADSGRTQRLTQGESYGWEAQFLARMGTIC